MGKFQFISWVLHMSMLIFFSYIARLGTTVLAAHNVNVRELETLVEAASMAGGELFRARAELLVPVSTDVDLLEKELENLANDLMVDIRLEK